MSAILNAATKDATTGAVSVTVGTSAPDHFQGGVPYESDGTVAVDLSSAVDHYQNQLPFTAAGRIATTLDTVASYGNGATPFYAGRLCMGSTGVDHYVHGVPYGEDGATEHTTAEATLALANLPNSTAATRVAIAAYVDAEVADGNWDLYDEVWVLSNPHDTDSLVGLKGLATATDPGTAENQGAEGWGHTSSAWHLTTDLNLTAAGLNYQQDDALITIWEREGLATANRSMFGYDDVVNNNGSVIKWMNSASAYTVSVNNNGTGPNIAPVDSKPNVDKLVQLARPDASNVELWVDGVKHGSSAVASRTIPSGNVQIGGHNNEGTPVNGSKGVMSYVSVGADVGVDKKAQARNVRDLLRTLGTTNARFITNEAPTVIVSGTDWTHSNNVTLETGGGASLGSETSDDSTHELVDISTIPGGIPAELAALAPAMTQAVKVSVRSSDNTSSFTYNLSLDLSDFGLEDIEFSDAEVGNFGLVIFIPDDTVWNDQTSSPAIDWTTNNNHEIKMVCSQNGTASGGDRLQFVPGNGVVSRSGWNYLKFHLDMDNLDTASDPLGDGAAGGFNFIRLQFIGWRKGSFGAAPALDPVAGQKAEFYIAAITYQDEVGSTPCVLFNYDHFHDTQITVSNPLHVTHKVPYTVSGGPYCWNPAHSGADETPVSDRMKVSEIQTIIDSDDVDSLWTHHFGSGDEIPTSYPFPSYAQHPNSLREYWISSPGVQIQDDFSACVTAMQAKFTGQATGAYRVLSYAGGLMLHSITQECIATGIAFARGTSLSQDYSYPSSGANPLMWVFNNPELFVNKYATNALNIEDGRDRYLQDSIDHINAVIVRGGTVDLWMHRPIPNATQTTITGFTLDIAGVVTVNDMTGIDDGDRVTIYGVNGNDGTLSWSDTPRIGMNYAHFLVRNKSGNTFELEDPHNTGSSVDTTGFTAHSSGGTVTLAGVDENYETTEATVDATLEYIRAKMTSGDIVALNYYDYAHDLGLV